MSEEGQKVSGKPALEWIAVSIGLVLTLGLVGFVGWQALSSSKQEPPRIVVETGKVHPYSGGWVVEVTARNLSGTTAAGVEIEGTLTLEDGETTATATLDYVPGHSTREAGLFLTEDPRTGQLKVQARGYAAP